MPASQICLLCGKVKWKQSSCRSCLIPDGHYTTEQVCRAAGITMRQCDYWHRSGILERNTPGTGFIRSYTRVETMRTMIVAALVEVGVLPSAAGKLARAWNGTDLNLHRHTDSVVLSVNLVNLSAVLDGVG